MKFLIFNILVFFALGYLLTSNSNQNFKSWFTDKKDQIKCFEEHIIAAQKTQIPLIIHTRNAESETLEILKNKLKRKNFKLIIKKLKI